jgi:hypothetical protein
LQDVQSIIIAKYSVHVISGLVLVINILISLILKSIKKNTDDQWKEINKLREKVAKLEGKTE